MAYTSAQKDAVERRDIKEFFRIGHRQWQDVISITFDGGANDTVQVYFSSWWKKSKNAEAYEYMKGNIKDLLGRMGKIMVIVSSSSNAFIDVRVPIEIGTNIAGQTSYNGDYNGTGKRKVTVKIKRSYAEDLNGTNKANKRVAKFVCRHENLHAFGFEHSFANTDGDIDLNLSVLDTDMDYFITEEKRRLVENGSVSPGRIAGPLDREVLDQRMKPYYD